MSSEPFTIEQFYKFMQQKRLMAGKCRKCGKTHLPPRPLCDNCFSKEFDWVEVDRRGTLLTFTVIHIPPTQFQDLAPYAVGIVKLEKDLRIPGIISGLEPEKIRIDMRLIVDFETCNTAHTWPQWPRYCFKPL